MSTPITGLENSVDDNLSIPDNNEKRIFASPLAKRLAQEAGIKLDQITGTGPHGRIVKYDVETALTTGSADLNKETKQDVSNVISALPAMVPTVGNYTEIPNSNTRKIIANRLTESSRDIPAYMVTVDCIIDHLLELRLGLNAKTSDPEAVYKISVNDFIIRAAALAMRKVPGINTSWTEASILQYDNIDISVAVSTPDGLITPIIRNADHKGLADISIEMKLLAVRARDNKLLPEEFQGGGFTISNLGMFGVKEFTSIINPPQSCILSVGAGDQRPTVIDGALGISTVMTCTLTSDHRSVDGALSAEFMRVFKALIEDPLTMLL